MQPVATIDPETLEYLPENYFVPLDLQSLFPRQAPLELDLGCGDGSFLVEWAAQHPDRNFLGVERLMGRVRKTCKRAVRAGLTNVRLLRLESHYLVRYLLPKQSVSRIHVMFPDPWPKRKHQGKRLIQTEFLDAVHDVLTPDGELRLSTDDQPYYMHMRCTFEQHPKFREIPWQPGEEYPQTDFERVFRAKGLPIYRALLQKVS
jgi:tRNA (guanine-N7-)-methyltransferase